MRLVVIGIGRRLSPTQSRQRPITAWHQHENFCVTPFGGFEFSLMTPYATCPIGAIDISASPMLHVWIVDNPKGGPFAVDIDPSVVAQLDRT